MSRITAFVLCALCVAPVPARPAVYYVSTLGNDSGPGTPDYPLRTIQQCADRLVPGDTCVVLNGRYVEEVRIITSGSQGAPITLRSESLHGAVVAGQFTVAGSYVAVTGFAVTVRHGNRWGISLDGAHSEASGNRISADSTALGLNNTAIRISGIGNRAADNRSDRMCFGFVLHGTRHTVERNEVSELERNGSCGDMDYLRFFGGGHVIRHNTFHKTDLAKVGAAHVDCFQSFDNNGPADSLRNVILEGNFCSDAHQGVMIDGDHYLQSSGLILRNNVFTRVLAWCVCIENVTDVRVYNNTCDTTAGIHGMWCRFASSCEFKNNTVFGTGTLYGVMDGAALIDGDASAPGKSNLLFKPGMTITGFANDIKNVDPSFVASVAGDFHIRPGSPARDAGVTIRAWENPTDRDGVLRPQGRAWDIGAYEWEDPRLPTRVRPVPLDSGAR